MYIVRVLRNIFPVFFLLMLSTAVESKKEIVDGETKGLLALFRMQSAKKNNIPLLMGDSQLNGASVIAPDFDDGTELSRNKDILGDMFENDMVLTKEQISLLLARFGKEGEDDEETRRVKRKIIKQSAYRWGRTIPYRISVSSSQTRQAIESGLRHWQENTCLTFSPSSSSRDYIQFIQGRGCYSNVGKVGYAQEISIGNGCEIKGIVAHEVGHALGLWHEQSRPDRDQFITVNYGSIVRQAVGNFEKRTWSDTSSFGVPYDLGSVMHYAPSGFATTVNGKTMSTKDKNFQNTMGQRTGLSFTDIKVVNKAYCSGVCGGSGSCQNGGYPNPKSCSQCKCPSGLTGRCDQVAPSTGGCGGGELRATSSWQSVRVNNVRPNQDCHWRITSNGGKIVVEFQQLSYPCQLTCSSYAEIKYKSSMEPTGARLCCGLPSKISSESSQVILMHHTDARTGSNYRGFTLRYRSVGGNPGPTQAPATRKPATPRPVRPRPIATARPRPTPRPGPVVPKPGPTLSGWGQWSAWSPCSRSCGGCGKSQRKRVCSSNTLLCNGRKTGTKTRRCRLKPCPVAVVKEEKCTMDLQVPCELLHNRRRDNNRRPLFSDPIPATANHTQEETEEELPEGKEEAKEGDGSDNSEEEKTRSKRQSTWSWLRPTGGRRGGRGGRGRGGRERGGRGRGRGGWGETCTLTIDVECDWGTNLRRKPGSQTVSNGCCDGFEIRNKKCHKKSPFSSSRFTNFRFSPRG